MTRANRERPSLEPRRRFLGRMLAAAAGVALPAWVRPSRAANQSAQPFLGEIMLISFHFAPRGWGLCNGQLLPIVQNQGLFSLLGTTYGGNGVTTFGLPDLRGRLAIHQGQGPGLTARTWGERAGADFHTLTLAELPTHTHVARATSAAGTVVAPSASVVPARNPAQVPAWGTVADTAMSPLAMTSVGGGQAHANQHPFLTLNYVIALTGVFPSQ